MLVKSGACTWAIRVATTPSRPLERLAQRVISSGQGAAPPKLGEKKSRDAVTALRSWIDLFPPFENVLNSLLHDGKWSGKMNNNGIMHIALLNQLRRHSASCLQEQRSDVQPQKLLHSNRLR